MKLDFWSGSFTFILLIAGYLICNLLFVELGDQYLRFAVLTQIICWTLQFIGHGVFENKRPALFDNIFLTTSAPLFVVLEVMMIFGYKPELHELIKPKKN